MIAENFPLAPRPFIDLSTGINPYAYPIGGGGGELAYRLADFMEMEKARSSAAAYYGTDPENINLASGMQQLMFALASLRFRQSGAAKIMVLSPTYSEYEKLWLAAGHEVTNVQNIGGLSQADVAVICNPNNPDGKIYTPDQLRQLKNEWLIIDESFADLEPPSTIHHPPSTIRMRSCGKFFGIAGLRVSSVIAPEEISRWLRVVVGAWPIATPACLALPAMFENRDWIEETRALLRQESIIWRELLAQYFNIIGYTSLFTLVETKDAGYWYEKLAKNGILVRRFDYNRHWLRFGLPDRKHLERVKNIFNSALLALD